MKIYRYWYEFGNILEKEYDCILEERYEMYCIEHNEYDSEQLCPKCFDGLGCVGTCAGVTSSFFCFCYSVCSSMSYFTKII